MNSPDKWNGNVKYFGKKADGYCLTENDPSAPA